MSGGETNKTELCLIEVAEAGVYLHDRDGDLWRKTADGAVVLGETALHWKQIELTAADKEFGPFSRTAKTEGPHSWEGVASGDRFKGLTADEVLATGHQRTPSISAVAALIQRWQTATFGPPESRSGCTDRLEHIQREVREATRASLSVDQLLKLDIPAPASRDGLASELADIGTLWLSACAEAGMDPAVIMYRKLIENRGRTWPAPDAGGILARVDKGGAMLDRDLNPRQRAMLWRLGRAGDYSTATEMMTRTEKNDVDTLIRFGLAEATSIGAIITDDGRQVVEFNL